MAKTLRSPFETLSDIATKSSKLAVGLPAQDEAVELWNGIGFSIGGTQFVAGMGTVSELLPVPKFTPVPGVRPWVLGISNVRGRLIPIIDLGRFFGFSRAVTRTRDKRILVIEQDELLNGFVVDAVQGMQYFSAESFIGDYKTSVDTSLGAYVKGAYVKGNIEWLEFDTLTLINDENFLDVALR
jgi:twitching motility protein PilI